MMLKPEDRNPTVGERAVAVGAAVLFILATPLLLVATTIRDGWEFVFTPGTRIQLPPAASPNDK